MDSGPQYYAAVFVADKLADDILARHEGDVTAALLEASNAYFHLRDRIIRALHQHEDDEPNLIVRSGHNARLRLAFSEESRYRAQAFRPGKGSAEAVQE